MVLRGDAAAPPAGDGGGPEGGAAALGGVAVAGGLSHGLWRSFESERRSGECRGFVDGDLVEVFLSLPRPQALKVTRLLVDDGWVPPAGFVRHEEPGGGGGGGASGGAAAGAAEAPSVEAVADELWRRVDAMARRHA